MQSHNIELKGYTLDTNWENRHQRGGMLSFKESHVALDYKLHLARDLIFLSHWHKDMGKASCP